MNDENSILVDQEMIDELAESFHDGPIIGSNQSLLTEKTIGRIKGLKVEIFFNEHPPPHFRVSYQGESANFTIKECEKMNGGLNVWNRNIIKWHRKNKFLLVKAWDENRPSDCTVGFYKLDEAELDLFKQILKKYDNNSSDYSFLIKKISEY